MDAKSQLLLRSPSLFAGKVLLAGLPADDLLSQLPEAFGWSWQMDSYAPLSKCFGERCAFGVEAPQTLDFSAAILFLPKSREQTDYLLSNLAARVMGKPLYLVGEKRAGIERAAKQLQAFGSPHKLDSARHCQLWRVEVEQAPQKPLTDWIKQYEVALADGNLQVISLPGVFAHGHLDAGTALLLEQLGGLPRGAFLDFGCGAGVLGAALARRYPGQPVTLLDNCAFAVQSAQLTLKANQLSAEVLAADGIAGAPVGLAAIISNPPFHQGIATSYQTSEDLLREARAHLAINGELRIVANRFLKYPPLMAQFLGGCETLAERGGFHVLRSVNRPAR